MFLSLTSVSSVPGLQTKMEAEMERVREELHLVLGALGVEPPADSSRPVGGQVTGESQGDWNGEKKGSDDGSNPEGLQKSKNGTDVTVSVQDQPFESWAKQVCFMFCPLHLE